MPQHRKRIIFALFFTTGFSSLLFAIVWLRLALVAFGAITPVLSGVNSLVLLGIALGSWLGGAWISGASPLARRARPTRHLLFAAAQCLIAAGAAVVPAAFSAGSHLLLRLPSLDSLAYLAAATFVMGLATLPFTFLMGAAFPLMMAAEGTGFGFLYLANGLGGVGAAFAAAYVLIELNGLRGTLFIAAELNLVAALLVVLLVLRRPVGEKTETSIAAASSHAVQARWPELAIAAIGFCAFGTQAIWARLFTPLLGTTVYGFACLLMLYLLGTSLGTWLYLKRSSGAGLRSPQNAMRVYALFGVLQVILVDPRFGLGWAAMILVVVSVCAASGYLTPLLIESRRREAPARVRRAGRIYAYNVAGCVVGPLVAVYALLPNMSERSALLLMALPAVGVAVLWGARRFAVGVGAVAAALGFFFVPPQPATIFRDHTASVEVVGRGHAMSLVVNSVATIRRSSDEKMMAHLPIALHAPLPVRSVLVIGLGTGTAFRAALNWGMGADVTVVEILPSIVRALDSFYPGATAALAANPLAHIVIDDPRRYLARKTAKYDVIVVNPTPPLDSASSAMLYSVEFYALAKSRLNEGGILQQWYPISETRTFQAVVRSLLVSFPYLRGSRSIENAGVHFIGSTSPIPVLDSRKLAASLSPTARLDLLEWLPSTTPEAVFDAVLARRIRPTALVSESSSVVVTDDHPYNEYFKVRRSSLLEETD